jgi:hypothetical protein
MAPLPTEAVNVLANGEVNVGDLLELSETDGEVCANEASTRPVGRALNARSGTGSTAILMGPL